MLIHRVFATLFYVGAKVLPHLPIIPKDLTKHMSLVFGDKRISDALLKYFSREMSFDELNEIAHGIVEETASQVYTREWAKDAKETLDRLRKINNLMRMSRVSEAYEVAKSLDPADVDTPRIIASLKGAAEMDKLRRDAAEALKGTKIIIVDTPPN